ncbi:hypothetical protein SAY86_006300 [Trapa natans]|uniref:Uncharacterized protein n=1 Tax=Trapa natans TaxID=22666 RepID=A0AAN7QU58_TRANT|nr:hypothetical protein SAY86_006300 [Trapa natans]
MGCAKAILSFQRNSLQKKLLALEHPESRVSTSIRATDHHVLHSGRWNIKKLCCGEPDNVLIGGASPDGIQHQFMECSKFTGTVSCFSLIAVVLQEGHPKCSIFREEAMEAMAEALDCRFCNENVQEKEKASDQSPPLFSNRRVDEPSPESFSGDLDRPRADNYHHHKLKSSVLISLLTLPYMLTCHIGMMCR